MVSLGLVFLLGSALGLSHVAANGNSNYYGNAGNANTYSSHNANNAHNNRDQYTYGNGQAGTYNAGLNQNGAGTHQVVYGNQYKPSVNSFKPTNPYLSANPPNPYNVKQQNHPFNSNKQQNSYTSNSAPINEYASNSQTSPFNANKPVNPYKANAPLNPYASSNQANHNPGHNQNNPSAPSYDYKQPSIFRPVVQPKQNQGNTQNPNRQYAPVITNAYIPPTTFTQDQKPASKDSFFDVTNPLSNKRDVISAYKPQNNFVNPTNFIIPSEDKYSMVNKIFGGFGPSANSGGNGFSQPPRSLDYKPSSKSIDDRLKSLGQNYYGQNGGQSGDFNLGFFNDDKAGASKQDIKKTPNPLGQVLSKDSNTYSPGKPTLQPDYNSQAKPSIYDVPTTVNDAYQKNSGHTQQQQSSSTPYQNGLQTKFSSGQGYQDNQGHSDQGHQNFDNSYNTKSSDGNSKVTQNQGGDGQFSFYPQQNTGILNTFQNKGIFNAPKPYSGSLTPYTGASVFNANQSPTPLFNGFSPNKRLGVDEFRSKSLLGGDDFGKTQYDQSRPTSTSILGSDLYRQANFGHNPLQQPKQQTSYGKGGNGFNQILGNTQTVGTGYDNVQSNTQGYNKAFDGNSLSSIGNDKSGGFNTFNSNNQFGKGNNYNANSNLGGATGGNKGGYSDQGGFSKSYQSSDSFKDGGGHSDGKNYADSFGYSNGNIGGNEYSNNDENQHDFKDGYENQQQLNDKKVYSNADGYNNAYTDANKYDQRDGYTDKINYDNKDSDSSQSQYSTNEGYDEGVANVGSVLAKNQVNPYNGLKTSARDGLSDDAKYKPFDVNGPVHGGAFF